MAKTPDTDLVEAIRADLAGAWERITSGPETSESVYAFGLYTTEDAAYFYPFVMGERGLEQAAQRYVLEYGSTLEHQMQNLRWSTADSPHECAVDHIGKVMSKRPDPYSLSEVAAAREIRARFVAAVEALKSLDKEGLFGNGKDRRRLTVYLEGGDCSNEFLLRWAKKLNPPIVFQAFEQLLRRPTVGIQKQYGTKKVRETYTLARTEDRRLITCAADDFLCVFDAGKRKQLMCRSLAPRGDYLNLHGATMTRDGSSLAVIAGWSDKEAVLVLLSGKDWKNRIDVKLPRQPLSLASERDGSWHAVSCHDCVIYIYEHEGKLVKELTAHEDWPRTLAVSPDQSLLASADDKRGVRLWHTADWRQQRAIEDRGNELAFDPTGQLLSSALRYAALDEDSRGEVLNIWRVNGTLERELRVPGCYIETAKWSPDGKTIAVGVMDVDDHLDHQALLIDAETGEVLDRLRAPFQDVNDFAFLPEQNAIAIAITEYLHRPLVIWELQ